MALGKLKPMSLGPRAVRQSPGRRFQEELDDAHELGSEGRWTEALRLLKALDSRYPDRPEALELICQACEVLKDPVGLQSVCHRLLKVRPDHPMALIALGN